MTEAEADLPASLRADLLDLAGALIADDDPDPWTADIIHGQARHTRHDPADQPVSPWSLP